MRHHFQRKIISNEQYSVNLEDIPVSTVEFVHPIGPVRPDVKSNAFVLAELTRIGGFGRELTPRQDVRRFDSNAPQSDQLTLSNSK